MLRRPIHRPDQFTEPSACTTQGPSNPAGERWRWLVKLGLAVGLLGAVGCQQPLFPEDAPRTPYERYMVLRGQYRPATEQDAYGQERPLLRERLRPLGEP
jgi:hypothetical protein